MKQSIWQFATTLVLTTLLSFGAQAQDTEIHMSDGGFYTGCGASLLDSGGSSGSYSNNENMVFTVCPGAPDTMVTLTFIVFDLGSGDVMNLYDGFGTGGTLIGSYTGTELGAQSISTMAGSVSNCITIEFISDDANTGNFGMIISCGPPCEPPVAIVETAGTNPILICVDEEVSLDGSNSTFADGASLDSYLWDFGDGTTDNTSGLVVTHSFDEPGEYVVQLYLTDDNECSSINLPDVQFLVSTTPSFDASTDSINICLGQEVDLLGMVEGTLWNGEPDNPIGGYLEIPDDQTQCFSSDIIFSNFVPGSTVTSESNFESIFVNMEHSFMGDITISIICPSGDQMTMHQQQGGGTYLGEPVDGDSPLIIPGVGYDYWWAPDATNGTWAAESAGVSTLPSGTYSSVQPWSNLIGCPLNGAWTLQICDLWGIDNGVVFDWTINFDPSLYPDITEFTPTFGAGCDSTFWAGPFITATDDSCNVITVEPTDLGSHYYTYSATDNHGCTYTHNAVITVEEGPIAQILNQDVSFCGNPVQIFASVANPSSGDTYQYVWSPADGLSNPNTANPFVLDISGDQTYTVSVFVAGEEVCGSEATVTVEFVPPVFVETEATICEGDSHMLPSGTLVVDAGIYTDTIASVVTGCDSVITTTLMVNPIYSYDVAASICGNDVVVLPNGTEVNEPGVYPVMLQSVNGCDSLVTVSVTVVTVDAGEYDPSCSGNLVELLNGSSSPPSDASILTWSGPEGVTFGNENDPTTNATVSTGGIYEITLTDSRCPDDPDTATLVLREPPTAEFKDFAKLCLGESRQLELLLTGDYTFPIVWSDGKFLYSEEEGSSVMVNGSDFADLLPNAFYQINVMVPGIAPCSPTAANIEIEIIDCEIVIPDIFTPNGDGTNETFEIPGLENFPGSKMVIYNRWGKVVYESDNYRSPYWNGTHWKSGAEVADGTYYFELTIGRLDEIEKGTITILRD